MNYKHKERIVNLTNSSLLVNVARHDPNLAFARLQTSNICIKIKTCT